MNIDTKYIVLFDGVCNLCNSMVQFIIKRDLKEKFRFASLQSESGQLLLKKFGLPLKDYNSFVFIKGDKYFLRSSAVLNVLKELGGMWKLVYGLIIFPTPLRDIIYNMIAKTRYKIFGKSETCMLPSPSLRKRFLH
ncbi:MAG TPA: thiol-disulfide oxidoreductase DCC family protein [Sphingobacteriaceae bacterium]|nr:thiol-disulfide oxidoreductase DCC family protein [Sphingobacteriaceae bacterium]